MNRWILGIAVATLSIVATWAGESPGQESAPPEKGGVTQSLGMPPVYKGYAGYAEKTDRDIPVVICEPST